MVGAEDHLPYDRPPLSKQILHGDWEPERVALRKPEVLAEVGVTWHRGVPAVGYDPAEGCVHLADGGTIPAEALIIATGAQPRDLPPALTEGLTPAGPVVTPLRTLDDALRIREVLQRRDPHAGETPVQVVVVGAGFIGLEVAAAARRRGHQVTVLEGAPAPLIRGIGAAMGEAIADLHRAEGVDVRCAVQVEAITDTGVRTSEGEFPADLVVVGIGVRPATDWLEGSGLILDDGVVCDQFLLATGPVGATARVAAAGDVARWHHPVLDEVIRVEHWTNAAEQGALAATNLLAVAAGEEPTAYAPVPFFWSDQFRHRIQFLGRAGAGDELSILDGSIAEGRWLAVYHRNGVVTAALGVNNPKAVMPYRARIGERL